MLKRMIRIFAVIYLSYLAICLLVLLPAMNIIAPRLVEQTTGRTLSSELILFNPFTLSLELRGMTLNAEGDGDPALVSFERARANLSLASLLLSGVVLDELSVVGLEVNVVRIDGDEFNFSDLLPAETAEPDDQPTELPAFTINHIELQADQLHFSDESRSPAYRTFVDNLAFRARRLSTVREAGSPYRLSIVTQHGGRLDWQGDLSLARHESEGDIRLTDIDLRPAYRYLAPQLAFVVDSALLDISGSYSASWRDTPVFGVEDGSVALRALRILPVDRESLPDTSVNLQAVTIDGIGVSSKQRSVSVDQVNIDGLALAGFSEGDTHSLLPMFVPLDDRPDGPAAATGVGVEGGDQDDPWQLSLQRLSTDNTRLSWRSPHTTPELIELFPLRAELRDIGWPAQGDSSVALSFRANDRSEFTLSGELDLGSGNGSFEYQLQGQPLAWINPVLGNYLRATIDDGALNISGSATLADFAPASVALETTVDRFAFNIMGRETSALSWDVLSIPGVRVDLQEQTVDVGRIALTGYRGTLHILPDGRLNAQMALPVSDGPENGSAAPNDGGDRDSEAPDPATDAVPWAIRADGLHLSDARVDFEDESLPIPFRTLIDGLEGDIGKLDSTQPEKNTDIGLQGSVDRYVPVRINGRVAPFAEPTALNINLHFRGMDISSLTPYSGTYAGYAIDSGTLNLDLSYSLEGDRLQGTNRVVISQMVLGDPVASEQALDLPLKLALALLTDSSGIIDLELPITGNLENPEFSLGKIIGSALRNILIKTVTAPFRFLADLVGSDEDLRELSFAPGSDTLREATRSKLNSLAEALGKRPALNVLVRGSINAHDDIRALKEQALEEQLMTGGALTTDSLASGDAARAAALKERYTRLMQTAENADPADTAQAQEVPAEQMREALLATMEIPQSALETLVRARAAAVKVYLVNERGIRADRVIISGRADDAQLSGAVLDVGP